MLMSTKAWHPKSPSPDDRGGSRSAVFAGGGAGFVDENGGEHREGWFEAPPNPAGEIFTGGIFEAVDSVQVVMIQLLNDRIGGGFDVAVVDEIALFFFDLALDDDFDSKRMAMQAAAFVAVGECRQIVGGFEVGSFAKANIHGSGSAR